jgi:molybdenum-dependent DNA-binding transcriptional regulator ModE
MDYQYSIQQHLTDTTMSFKYNAALLKKIEEIFKEGGYTIRYEKGNFQNGYCVLEKRRVVVINKFHEVDAKINSMMEILVNIQDLELENLSSESAELFQQVKAEKADLFNE